MWPVFTRIPSFTVRNVGRNNNRPKVAKFPCRLSYDLHETWNDSIAVLRTNSGEILGAAEDRVTGLWDKKTLSSFIGIEFSTGFILVYLSFNGNVIYQQHFMDQLFIYGSIYLFVQLLHTLDALFNWGDDLN